MHKNYSYDDYIYPELKYLQLVQTFAVLLERYSVTSIYSLSSSMYIIVYSISLLHCRLAHFVAHSDPFPSKLQL